MEEVQTHSNIIGHHGIRDRNYLLKRNITCYCVKIIKKCVFVVNFNKGMLFFLHNYNIHCSDILNVVTGYNVNLVLKIEVQSTIDISNSVISNSVKLEASI